MADISIPADPASIESEQAVLGAMLLNREAILAVADTLRPDYFYLERHRWIYEAMLACHTVRIPPDLRTVAEELRRRGRLDMIGGIAYLSGLTDTTPTSYHIGYYAAPIIKTAMRRRLLGVISRIGALAYNETEDIGTILEQAHDLIDGASVALEDPRYTPIQADLLDREDLPPVRWAIPGLLPQGLTLLIGKPKMRKSWLALATGIAVATGGRALGAIPVEAGACLYLALEDSKRRLQSRQRKILCGTAAPDRLHYLTTAPRLDEGLIGTIESWLRKHADARLVIVDVLAMVRPKQTGRGNMYDEDYSHIKPLQELAQRRDIAVLVVHHMNRGDATDTYDMINGSSGVGGAADGLLTLQYERGQQDATLTVSNRDLEDDDSLALRWDNQTAQWILLGKAEEVKASNERQEMMRIFREEKRPMGPKEVMELLGKTGEYPRIKQLMHRMAKEGDLQMIGRGMYTVPSLTLLADGEGNKGNKGDPEPITSIDGSPMPQSGKGNKGDPGFTRKNLDHLDHLVTLEGSEASESDPKGNTAPSRSDHLRYFDPLAGIGGRAQTALRLYLRSASEEHQAIARARCAEYGIDYAAARAAALGGPP